MNEHLLHPAIATTTKRLRDGDTIENPRRTALRMEWSPDDLRRILAFLRSSDIENLVQLLQRMPSAVAHPVVFHEIFYLLRLSRRLDQGILSEMAAMGDSVDPQEEAEAPPPGTRRAARDALHGLAAGWIRGILPGYRLEPIPISRPKGRPRKTSESEAEDLLWEFNQMHEELNAVYKPSCLRDLNKAASLVQQLHLASWRSLGGQEWIPGKARYDAAGKPNLYALRTRQNRLARKTLMAIAKEALKVHPVSKTNFLYGLLAYYTGTTIGSMRGIIDRAEAASPSLHHRRLR